MHTNATPEELDVMYNELDQKIKNLDEALPVENLGAYQSTHNYNEMWKMSAFNSQHAIVEQFAKQPLYSIREKYLALPTEESKREFLFSMVDPDTVNIMTNTHPHASPLMMGIQNEVFQKTRMVIKPEEIGQILMERHFKDEQAMYKVQPTSFASRVFKGSLGQDVYDLFHGSLVNVAVTLGEYYTFSKIAGLAGRYAGGLISRAGSKSPFRSILLPYGATLTSKVAQAAMMTTEYVTANNIVQQNVLNPQRDALGLPRMKEMDWLIEFKQTLLINLGFSVAFGIGSKFHQKSRGRNYNGPNDGTTYRNPSDDGGTDGTQTSGGFTRNQRPNKGFDKAKWADVKDPREEELMMDDIEQFKRLKPYMTPQYEQTETGKTQGTIFREWRDAIDLVRKHTSMLYKHSKNHWFYKEGEWHG